MKPLDLLQIYGTFQEAMAGTKIPAELKAQVAKEILDSLPPAVICAACPATREFVGQAMQDTLESLKPKHERTETPQAPQGETKTVRHRKASKEPVGE